MNLIIDERPLEQIQGYKWGSIKPIISSLPNVEPFDAAMLPPALDNYAFDVSDRQ